MEALQQIHCQLPFFFFLTDPGWNFQPLCPLVALVFKFLLFFHSVSPAGRRDRVLFGLCEECVSSVWVFLPLPPVYASCTVPRGA